MLLFAAPVVSRSFILAVDRVTGGRHEMKFDFSQVATGDDFSFSQEVGSGCKTSKKSLNRATSTLETCLEISFE